ncbi:hypothetical protein C5S35_02155 [Candidatus Methanophagaceae archaeon]|nr:hypothetical protein C5S35_02155 [Methanophagales archaeon]
MKPPIEMNDIKDFAYITSRKLQNEVMKRLALCLRGVEKARKNLITSLSVPIAARNRNQAWSSKSGFTA